MWPAAKRFGRLRRAAGLPTYEYFGAGKGKFGWLTGSPTKLQFIMLCSASWLLVGCTAFGPSTKLVPLHQRVSAATVSPRAAVAIAAEKVNFEPLKMEEKVALARASRNSTFFSQLTSGNATEAWANVREAYPVLEDVADDTLVACFEELKVDIEAEMAVNAARREAQAAAPSGGEALSAGAVPLVAVAAALLYSVYYFTTQQ